MPELKLKRKGLVCFECGVQADHAHHVVPRVLGGTKTVNLCLKCHAKVHSMEKMAHPILIKRGLAKRRAKGMYNGGSIRYGKKVVDDYFFDCSEEIKIIRMIHDLQKDHCLREIVDILNKKKITRRGHLWNKDTVWRVLKNGRC